jgi:hypothetical protein
MQDRSHEDRWLITCACQNTELEAHGSPIHIAICHCADCRSANDGDSFTQTLVMIRRDQVDTSLDGLNVVPGTKYNDAVPRYFCTDCGTCLLGDCSPIGFDMAIVPIEGVPATLSVNGPDYHMHSDEAIVEPANDNLPKYQANPEGHHMATLLEQCAPP